MPAQTISGALARFLVDLRRTTVPDSAIEDASSLLLDWFGSALAGCATDPGSMLHAYGDAEPEGKASVVGRNHGRAAETAAFLNGALSHIVEMDDLDRSSVLHPGAVVIPAALAVAEVRSRSGRELLSAIVAGYEVAIRIGAAVGKKHYFYFHNTSTCGVFGAAAAVSWLLDLDEERTVWALGNAGTQASGLWEFNAEGAMSKHLHAGRAAANGVLAALLAERGFTGPSRILEGERGFFRAMAPDADPERVTAGLGVEKLKIHGVSLKPHASCRHTHAAIDCALALRPRIGTERVEAVEVDTYPATLALCDRPRPQTPYDAKFSLQFCVASALQRGDAGLGAFGPDSIQDSTLRELTSRVRVRVEPGIEARYPREWPARVRVRLANGESLGAETAYPKGDPENPLSRSEIEDKFSTLAAFGGFEAAAEGYREWVRSLSERSTARLP
ncbi:MAG TPA: MmgE/PrpD family protein [Vicinamibacteria bacterium]